MTLEFRPMTYEAAKEILGWTYSGDYAMYNFTDHNREEAAQDMSKPENHFYAIFQDNTLLGHAVFHDEARVFGGDYSADALDIGIGMHPNWTGLGKGASIIAAILDFGQKNYHYNDFRASIAAWNQRAQKAAIRNGFAESGGFFATHSKIKFLIFTLHKES